MVFFRQVLHRAPGAHSREGLPRSEMTSQEETAVDSELNASTKRSGPGDPPRSRARVWIGRFSVSLTWTWAVVVLVALLLIRWVGDRWWGVTVLLFLPRWLLL